MTTLTEPLPADMQTSVRTSYVHSWQAIYCKGTRKNGQPCGAIIGMVHADYRPGTFEAICWRCQPKRRVVI